MEESKDKRIRLEMVQQSEYAPFHHWENPELLKQYYMDSLMVELKRVVAQLKPDEIINIEDNPYGKRYSIDIVINKR